MNKVLNEELLNRGLPKWSQMIVTGEPISQDQALEIIRRTDTFIINGGFGGNNRKFKEEAKKILKLEDEKFRRDFDNDEDYINYIKSFDERQKEWETKWNPIRTEYVRNSWISCSYIGGCHGWCNPDGNINFSDNVGKYPSVEEVYNEWTIIAKEFPFLNIGVTLMDGEDCEDNITPVVSMKIFNGTVELIEPEIENVHESHKENKKRNLENDIFKMFALGINMENKIPLEILEQWSKKVFG